MSHVYLVRHPIDGTIVGVYDSPDKAHDAYAGLEQPPASMTPCWYWTEGGHHVVRMPLNEDIPMILAQPRAPTDGRPIKLGELYLVTDIREGVQSTDGTVMGVYDSLSKAREAYSEMERCLLKEEEDSNISYHAILECRIVRVPVNGGC